MVGPSGCLLVGKLALVERLTRLVTLISSWQPCCSSHVLAPEEAERSLSHLATPPSCSACCTQAGGEVRPAWARRPGHHDMGQWLLFWALQMGRE